MTYLSTGWSAVASRPASALPSAPCADISSITAEITSGRPPARLASSASVNLNRFNALSCACNRTLRILCTLKSPSAALAFCPRMKYCQLPASSRRGAFLRPDGPTLWNPGSPPPPPPRPLASCETRGLVRRLMLSSLFAVPTARALASGDSATDNTGPGYFALCVTSNPSSSCTLTCPSSDPVKSLGAVARPTLPRCTLTKFSNDGGGPPSAATWQLMIVFWWHRRRFRSLPPPNTSHTHAS